MTQWAKNPTVVAWVAADWCSGLKRPDIPKAGAQIPTLAQELPYAQGEAIKSKTKK